MAESAARRDAGKRSVSTMAGIAYLFMLVAIGWQIYQFQVLPFTTIDGAYASTYEFFMGSTLAHLILLAFIGLGLWIRASKGRYAGGDLVPGPPDPVLRRVDRPVDRHPGGRRRALLLSR